jgi:ACT domain-containing protein
MQVKSTLAKLLANENIEVREGNYSTASFDVVNRVLCLPMWADRGVDVQDLLIGHEVGHALYTPASWDHSSDSELEDYIPQSYLNVVEDIRIERCIQSKYPGLVSSFKRGYQVLFDENFFGTEGRDLTEYGLPDRINIKAKLRDLVSIPFSSKELPVAKKCFEASTWEEVVEAARALYEFVKEDQKSDKEEESINETKNQNDQDLHIDQSECDPLESSDQLASSEQSRKDETPPESEEVSYENSPQTLESDYDVDESQKFEIETDNEFRRNESKLNEYVNYSPLAVKPLTAKDLQELVFDYKTVMQQRESYPDYYYQYGLFNNKKKEETFEQFINETKAVVNTMAKEFEMKKAAFRYSRSKTSKSGSLDVSKLYSYRYNEDIFARTTKLADAKNHGMVMLVDYSGSMGDVIKNVVKQVISLTMFCKKVNIPFRVYGFTSNYENNTNIQSPILWKEIALFELLSNEMSKAEYNTACKDMFIRKSGKCESMGGTPLNQAIIAMHTLIPAFKEKYNLDKVNFTLLSDGDSNSMQFNYGYIQNNVEESLKLQYQNCVLLLGDKKVEFQCNRWGTENLIKSLKEYAGCSTVCYFLTGRQHEVRYKLYNMNSVKNEKDIQSLIKDYRQGGCSVDNLHGFDRYFILRTKNLDASSEEFSPEAEATKGSLTRQFKKFTKSKKGNRVLANKFAEMVA